MYPSEFWRTIKIDDHIEKSRILDFRYNIIGYWPPKFFQGPLKLNWGNWGSCRDRHSLKFNKSWDMLIIQNFFQLQPQLKKWFMSNDSQEVNWLNTFSMTFRLFCCYDGIAGPTIFQFCVRFWKYIARKKC